MVDTVSLRAQTGVASQDIPAEGKGAAAGETIAPANGKEDPRGPMDWLEIGTVSPDGRLFVTSNHDRQVHIREVSSGRIVTELPDRTNQVVFSPDNRLVACYLVPAPSGVHEYACWRLFTVADGKPLGEGFNLPRAYAPKLSWT